MLTLPGARYCNVKFSLGSGEYFAFHFHITQHAVDSANDVSNLIHDMIHLMSNTQSPLRLRKKHDGEPSDVTAADGKRLVDAQSIRNAAIAGIITIVVFSLLWAAMTSLVNRVFPWMTVVLGYLLGYAVRRAGHGVDWQFPALAAVLAVTGSLAANILVAADYTAETFATDTLHILQSVTSMTWPVFFDEVLSVADAFYAAMSAGLAAFLANRRLTRQQYYALRLWRGE